MLYDTMIRWYYDMVVWCYDIRWYGDMLIWYYIIVGSSMMIWYDKILRYEMIWWFDMIWYEEMKDQCLCSIMETDTRRYLQSLPDI